MKMIKCFNGHLYNEDKFNHCPQCASIQIMDRTKESNMQEQDDIDTEEPDFVKRQKYEIVGRRKVVGCLICVKGTMKGVGFFLVEGHNDIGRGANLEVVLSKELTISRKAHACITYEEKQNQYYLTAADGKQDVFYNGKLVNKSVLIKDGGEIGIGQCMLRFVAFCNDCFKWGNSMLS